MLTLLRGWAFSKGEEEAGRLFIRIAGFRQGVIIE
tara:strand:+ start:4537 stop:4641 length:105 start_codon:yes stop_codon:yes gene_type:complete